MCGKVGAMAVTGATTSGNDNLVGDGADDLIKGAAGNDRITKPAIK